LRGRRSVQKTANEKTTNEKTTNESACKRERQQAGADSAP
jgi:hypothetical protein